MSDKCIVHGAAGKIGSSCIEVVSGRFHIILDYGKPLEGEGEIPFVFPRSMEERKNYIVVISHCHGDHAGFINEIPEDVPVYMSELTRRALLLSSKKNITRQVTVLHCFEVFDISQGVRVVLFPVSHSAPDACSILIGTSDNTILYTGDFREHGLGGNNLVYQMKRYIANVQGFSGRKLVVISEATNAGVPDKQQIEESDLCFKFAQEFKEPGLVVVKMSNQNIERIGSILTAVRATDRILVTEPYTALCAKELSAFSENYNGINLQSYNLRPDGKSWKVFNIQTAKTQEIADDGKLYQFGGKYKITKDQLLENKDSIVIIANTNTEQYLERKGLIDRVIWSMWTGYDGYKRLCEKYDVKVIHSSGHVFSEDWVNAIKELKPEKTIIVHTDHPEEAAKLIEALTTAVVAKTDEIINIEEEC